MEIWTRNRDHVINIDGHEDPTELARKLETIFTLKQNGCELFFEGADGVIGRAERLEINLTLLGNPIAPNEVKTNKRWKLF